MPDNLKKEMGHFNVFVLDELSGCVARPIPYSRRDYFKVSLINGHNRIHYADKTLEAERHALIFANPMIPYNWEPLAEEQTGFFCIFTEAFFSHFGNIKDYPVFRPGGHPVFSLEKEEAEAVGMLYRKMLAEIRSDYTYKYDALRNYVFELIHFAQRTQQAAIHRITGNASSRIASLFTELLERQFPIESPAQQIRLRTPLAFASHLSVHVNHLNRALKEVSGKTTSQLIAERITQEACMLLKHTDWNISEIGWCLGFEELSNFSSFFKKNTTAAPGAFRAISV